MATKKTSSKKATKTKSAAAGKAKGKGGKRRGGGAQKPGLHTLMGRAVADPKFLNKLLSAPEATLSGFSLDPATRRDVIELLANPRAVRRNISAFRGRFRGGPTVEAV